MGARECRAKRADHLGSEVCVTHIPFRTRSTLSTGDEVAGKVLALFGISHSGETVAAAMTRDPASVRLDNYLSEAEHEHN